MTIKSFLDKATNPHKYCRVCGDRIYGRTKRDKHPVCHGCIMLWLASIPMKELQQLKIEMFKLEKHRHGKALHNIFKYRRDKWGEHK